MSAAAASQQWPGAYGHQPQAAPVHNPGTEELNVIQEPERAKVVVKSRAKERKPIDPPPVVELKIRDERPGPGQIPGVWIHSPYYICVVCLWDGTYDRAYAPEENEVPLYGSLVSSLNKLKNLQETEGAYFVFGDISIGVQGRFRLCFNLYNLDPTNYKRYYRGYAVSRPFDVTSAREWDGVKESTSLSRSFADQGVRLRLRKETRGSANKRNFGTSSAPYTPMSESTTASHELGRSGGEEDSRDTKRQRSFHSGSGGSDYSQQTARPPYYASTTNGHQYSSYGYAASGPYSPGTLQQSGQSTFMYAPSSLGYSQSPYASQQSQYASAYPQSSSSYPYASASSTYGAQYGASSGYPSHQQQSAQYSGGYGAAGYGHRGSDQLPTPSTTTASQYGSQMGYGAFPTAQGYASRGDPSGHQAGGSSLTSPGVTRPMANPASTPTLAPLHRTEHAQQGSDDADHGAPPR